MSVYLIWESDFSPANAAAGLGSTEAIWRGEKPLLGCVQGKPRRWVVERTNAWHDHFRGLFVRWERIGSLRKSRRGVPLPSSRGGP